LPWFRPKAIFIPPDWIGEQMQTRPWFFLLVSVAATWCASFGASAKTVQLNQEKIHWEYSEGNFDTVTGLLEGFLKSKSSCSRADSVFLNKHLGVVYAANPNTREKGRYFFFRMLEIHPDADLSDMFVSEDIDALFTKAKLESAARRKSQKVDKSDLVAAPWKNMEPKNGISDTLKRPVHVPTAKSSPGKSADPELNAGNASSHPLLWTVAVAGLAAAAAGAYFYFTGSVEDAPTTVYTIPETVASP
jgi:hypothetical protein